MPCPALLLLCEQDTVAPMAAAEKAAALMPQSEVRRYPVGHFDIYQGEAPPDQPARSTRLPEPAYACCLNVAASTYMDLIQGLQRPLASTVKLPLRL